MRLEDLRVRTSAKVRRGELWLHPEDHRAIYTPQRLVEDLAGAKRLPDSVRFPKLRARQKEHDDEAARQRIQRQIREELARRAAGGDT